MVDVLKGLFGGGDGQEGGNARGIAGEAAQEVAGAAEAVGHNAERAARKAERAARRAASPEERQKIRQHAEDFVNRYHTGDPLEGYSDEEALANFMAVAKHATPEQLSAATQMAVANLPENQRAEFAQMLEQRQQGMGLVDIQRSGQPAPSGGQAGGASLDDVFGGLLGGLLGAGQGGGKAMPMPMPQGGQIPGAGNLGDLFEKMIESGDAQVYTWSGSPGELQKQMQQNGGGLGGFINTMMQGGGQPVPQGGGFGDILNQMMGGMAGAQPQQRPAQQGGGLGDILNTMMGGQQAQPAPQPAKQGGGLLSSPLTKAVLGGAAAILMKQMLQPKRG